MTFSWSAKRLRRRRGLVKGPEVEAVVGEGEGDQAHEQGLQSQLGELMRQKVAPQEAVAVPAPPRTNQRLPTRPVLGTKSDTMMLIPFASTFPGNKRRERGVKQKRKEQ